MQKRSFGHLKEGDRVIRLLAGKEIPMKVTRVRNSVITCEIDRPEEEILAGVRKGAEAVSQITGVPVAESEFKVPDWHFSAVTGGEIDVHLGYDGIYTCSFLKERDDSKSNHSE